ncbi:hypothetical protein EJ06DRAFT_505900 [Trichodelitschia bisporula]|uniref:MICOS complex subunit MIC60 n=1 Tax=Trichodelitschia bisporula TaxID=703511 RepID=A0A6G1I3W4_9PEZI|nr:hypothetical protein EJ06DRAFT_505900 [Trichodelitschia bisporula]
MLRVPIARSRALASAAVPLRPAAQWHAHRLGGIAARRFYAEDGKFVAPTGTSPTGTTPSVTPPTSTIGRPAIPPATTPPTGTGTASVAPPPTTPTPPKKKRRVLRFLANLLILGTLGYGIGVYYALTSDNWHDFFTEYVPFGEEVVAYFEEREFRKRFLERGQSASKLYPQVRGEQKVKVAPQAGVSARTVEDDLDRKGRHVSAVEAKPTVDAKPATPSESHKLMPKDELKKEVSAPLPEKKGAPKEAPKKEPKPAATNAAPASFIDGINIEHAEEPVVQDVVKILNNIITAINADASTAGKLSPTLEQAKSDITKVVNDITTLKSQEQSAADSRIRALHAEFDKMAHELLRRQEATAQEQEVHWKEEYEAEQRRLSEAYAKKLEAELESANRVADAKLQNRLKEQAVQLRRQFTAAVAERVEAEREGRLGKLSDLSERVAELDRLTAEWDAVVSANLRAQHLIVAVEAVRSALEESETAGVARPFVRELAAVKEAGAANPVIDAAIASVHPSAYQKGIPSGAELVERFRRVAGEVRKAALLPDNAGVASHAASLVLSKVMFRKGGTEGVGQGGDVESVLARAERALEEGRLEVAVDEVNALEGWAKVLSRDWLADCRRVLEVKQAVDVIATEARLQSLLVE